MKFENKSKIFYSTHLPQAKKFGSGSILIYDKIFDVQSVAQSDSVAQSWIRGFERRYAVKSGEKLKNLDQLAGHLKRILAMSSGLATQEIVLVVFGGGSVGDFGGFVASILKRGVRLVHIPSTWLAAVDSAHGGKTGLNVSKIKNQIGSFYPASEIHMVRDILVSQPTIRVNEALGEIMKISLIEGRSLWSSLQKVQVVDAKIYWNLLPQLVKAKYRIVNGDPFESKGLRHILNLGHTVGHVWESKLKMPHGTAVLFGLAFALEWSLQKKILTSKSYYQIRLSEIGSYLPDRKELESLLRRTKSPSRLLLQDKKISKGSKIRFVYLAAPGKPVIQPVALDEILKEMKRQSM